ncbi:MAG: hypothetical protein GY856_00890 [bacterium]|nr:hypothetical protein [bacterium]
MAKRLERHVASVSRVEHPDANPAAETIYRFLDAIGCSLWHLVELLDPDGRPEPRYDTWEERMEEIARRVFADEMAKMAKEKGPRPVAGRGSPGAGR